MTSISDTIEEYGTGEPLSDENDRYSMVLDHFDHEGIECATYLIRQSHYCGYVRVPEGLIGKVRIRSGYDELDGYQPPALDVHGGITYGPDDDNWIGFDTVHAGDGNFDENLEELPHALDSIGEPEFIWTPEAVKEHTEELAEQVAALAEEHGVLDSER